jgi:hypothetical protein
MIRTSALLGGAIVLVVCPGASKAAAPPRSDEQLARWARDLDDDRFAVRESAHRNLSQAGRRALPALVAAATSESLEVATRAFRLLRRLLGSADDSTIDEVRAVLNRLAASGQARTAAKARSVLRGHQGQIVARLEKGGGRVSYRGDQVVSVDLDGAPRLAPLLPLLRYLPDLESLSASNRQMDDAALAQLVGLRKLQELNLYQSGIGDGGLVHLKSLPALRRVPMGETKVTDAGLKHIAGLTQLEYVGLRGNLVTNAGLVHLRKLTNLTGLHLGETRVTNAGLAHLADMKKVEYLFLHNVAVSDAGLVHLEALTGLQRLYLWKTRVSPEGLARLRRALPKVVVKNER